MTHTPSPAATVWCRRNALGRVIAVAQQTMTAAQAQAAQWEDAAPYTSEVDAFLREVSVQSNALSQTDSDLARVLEDLIDALITRGVIQFTDLPQAAQGKLLERRQTRASLTHRLQLLPLDGQDDSGVI
jgi:hypothetical protein